jgi:periplasmic divalent cation tolerance protein
MSDLILIYTLCPNLEEAEKLANALLEQRLIACANVGSPVTSHYIWQGKREKAAEIPVFLKTTADQYDAVEKYIIEMHPYDVPCVTAIPTAHTYGPYLEWARNSVKAALKNCRGPW